MKDSSLEPIPEPIFEPTVGTGAGIHVDYSTFEPSYGI